MTIWIPDITSRSGPKYIAIADMVGEAIADGELTPGDKLPPQRDLAYDLGVTLGTITRAYQEATRRKLIGGKVGRGTYVLGPHEPTDTTEIFTALNPASKNALDFSMAIPTPGDTGRRLSETLAEISKSNSLGSLMEYQPNTGLSHHLEAGARWISQTGLDAPAERVALTNGAQQGIMLSLLTVARPGDIILTDILTYPGIIHLANQLGFQLQGVAMDGQGMIPDALDEVCRHTAARAVYLMPTLQNPTTLTMPEHRRREIVEVARRHNLQILEDDLWRQLQDSPLPAPLSHYAPERSFYICSLSKCMAGGLRVGYVLAPNAACAATLRSNVRINNWMTAPLMAEIASRWIADGTGDELIAQQRGEIRKRTGIANDALKGFPLTIPPNTLHLWLELPPPWRANDFQAEAMRQGIQLLTSENFMVGRDAAPHAVRICIGGNKTARDVERGMKIIANILKTGPEAGLPVI